MTLKVTPQEVHTKATQIDTQSVSMENTLKQLESEITKFNDIWKSKSGDEFLARYRVLKTNCTATLDRIRKHASNLRETAASYERTETRNYNEVSKLGTGNVLS